MKKKIDKKIFIYLGCLIFLIAICGATFFFSKRDKEMEIHVLDGTVLAFDDGMITVEDGDNIYTFSSNAIDADVGANITLKYTGILDSDKEIQNIEIVSYEVEPANVNVSNVPKDFLDDGIFSEYYDLAYKKLESLSKEEKIGQMLLVRYPDSNQIEVMKKYNFGGYLFFEKDFRNKTKEEVQEMTKSLQSNSNIPLLTAADEEGGSVVRISSNPNLASSRFLSPRELYNAGGLEKIASDTKEKSNVLSSLGINLNLAPVVDVSTSSSDYMYSRSIGQNTSVTSEYAKTVIEASKGLKVSYTLKHFPGYGNNTDTHSGTAIDERSLEDIKKNDLPPFEAGIKAGAEAVLVSHNTVNSIDPDNPASLSESIHKLLRDDLHFTGIIITDDLAMGATSSISDAAIKAVKAGNDIIITTDYENTFNLIKSSLDSGDISEGQIDRAVFRILAWKYYKGLMFDGLK